MSRVGIRRDGTERPLIVAEQIGDDTLDGGVGGWESLDRPGRGAMTAWGGTPGVSWTLPLSLDGMHDDRDEVVERECALLDSWGRPLAGEDRPPALVVNARVGRAPATARWVIQAISWGAQIRNASDERIRQDLELTLLEYVPGRVLKGPGAKSRDKGGKKHKWVPVSAKDRRCKVCKRPRGDKIHTNRGD